MPGVRSPGLLLLLALAGWSPAPVAGQEAGASGRVTGLPGPGAETRRDLLDRWARAYFPGRTGDIAIVPREGHIVTGTDPDYPYMHGSPWDYDARIPLILHGPGRVRPGAHPGPASHDDLGATLTAVLGLAPAPGSTGRVLSEALLPGAGPPGLVVLLVLDAFHPDYLDRYADRLPALLRIRREGASFPEARIDYLPTATAVAHASMATASQPRVHGITGNSLYDTRRRESLPAFPEGSPRHLMALSFPDRWGAATGGRAVIVVQGGTDYAAAALAGHGGCAVGIRRPRLAYYDSRAGGWATNRACYELPGYLRDDRAESVWSRAGGRWLGHEVGDPDGFRRSALFAAFQADAVVEAVREEPFAEDRVTDLLLVNLKAPDYVGHKYGPSSPETEEALAELDRQVERIRKALEEKTGPRGSLLALTADHGMPPEPKPPARRHTYGEIRELLRRRFDPRGSGIVLHLGGADLQLFLDDRRLDALGVSVERVAEHLESLPFIAAAFTRAEVRRAAGLLSSRGKGREGEEPAIGER